MTEDNTVPQLGQIVRITKGREQNQYAVVINILDDRFVSLADGEKRKYDRPKRKNVNHIEGTPFISSEVRNSLLETNRVSNGKLRFAIAKYASEVVTDLERGDEHDV
ncbi:KOW domain-containing RNA-binding protein [Pseudogracilibacillus auburnensis]|uniref:KOW domain-containing RNA-binding protein n=1 Tax=Pseudogracilibacillus auburnensis TaxID=1494959 RepID=UPI001A9736D2|nr:KOW domain-containing RNA-binding protein [Pseudogracilibacillus auburnensis]MBO1005203.1 KOW domain-containing RNA-binding protein [Pseudogracilibacillus auburnensis]